MNHRQHQDLIEREARRKLILAHICPECKGQLSINLDMEQKAPKYSWFTCDKCFTTVGVNKT